MSQQCTLKKLVDKDAPEPKERYNPENPLRALCFQLHDDLDMVYRTALYPKTMNIARTTLEMMKMRIDIALKQSNEEHSRNTSSKPSRQPASR